MEQRVLLKSKINTLMEKKTTAHFKVRDQTEKNKWERM